MTRITEKSIATLPGTSSRKPPEELFDTASLRSDLRGRSVRGGAVTFAVQGCKFVLQTGSTMVMARLLTPADFGLIAMVTAVTGFLAMFKDLGLSTATIQKAEINHAQVSTLFWVNVGLSLLVGAVVMALAPAIAWFYGDPRLTPVTLVLGAAFLFGGLSVQHQAMLTRHMRFFAKGVVEIVSTAVGLAAGIAAGLWGAGYWSLVIMSVTTVAVAAAGKWIAFPWLPGRPVRGVGVKAMLGFGGNITASNLVNYFARNADNILIGKFLGSSALGLYNRAYGLLMLPISQIRQPLFQVVMPALSRLQHEPGRFRNYYLKMLQLLAILTFPMAALMWAYSHQIILLVLGPQWVEAAAIFNILAFAALIQAVDSTAALVVISLGHGRRYSILVSTVAVILVISFVVGLPWGVKGVALSYTIANYATVLPFLVYAFHGSPVRVRDFFNAISLPFVAMLIMLLGSMTVFHLCAALPETLALFIALLAAGLFYLAAFMILPGGSAILKDMRANLELILKPRQRPAPQT